MGYIWPPDPTANHHRFIDSGCEVSDDLSGSPRHEGEGLGVRVRHHLPFDHYHDFMDRLDNGVLDQVRKLEPIFD